MRDTDLFQLALGLVPPWMVKTANFDPDKKRLDLEIDFTTGGRFPCPDCDATVKRHPVLTLLRHEELTHLSS